MQVPNNTSMDTLTIAAVQMISGEDVQANLQQAKQGLEQAHAVGAQVAVLPEYFCLMGQRDKDKLSIAEVPGQGPIQDFLAKQAQRFGLYIIGGTLPLQGSQPDKVFNSTLVFAPDGRCIRRYDKMHLFAFDNGQERYDEGEVLQAGQQCAWVDIVLADQTSWRLGLTVCYDLRFPELYRQLMQNMCDGLIVTAAFTATTGLAHWEVLLRARAIENQCYVVASAQGGAHSNGRSTYGHSMSIDPWGVVQSCCPSGFGVAHAQWTRARLAGVRQQLPALQHRKI